MKENEQIDLHDLVNKLNNEQIVFLLNIIFNNRPTEVYIGMFPENILQSAELSKDTPVCLNGTVIQINTEYSFTGEKLPFMENNKTN
tara:strand:- start:173 stop:433 length:261 start_codon:yes stop_codon:yes gene_type:complete